MGSLDLEVSAVTGIALFSAGADVDLFSVEAGVKSFIILWSKSVQISDSH